MEAIKERKARTTTPVENPEKLSHEELVRKYQELAEGMKGMKQVFSRSRKQTDTQREEKKTAQHTSMIDALTGLGNRRYLLGVDKEKQEITAKGALYVEVSKAWRDHQPISVMYIDLDKLKEANKLSHDLGDKLLKTIAEVLTTDRGTNIPCRVGGDEFVTIVPGAGSDDAKKAGERIRRRFKDAVAKKIADGKTFTSSELEWLGKNQPSVTIGVATYPDYLQIYRISAHKPEEFEQYKMDIGAGLIADADAALMHKAKNIGIRDTVVVAPSHPDRVSFLASRIANEMNLSVDERAAIIEAGMYHDVGKLKLPRQLFLKTDGLSAEEIALLHSHPALGAEMVRAHEEDKNKERLVNSDTERVVSIISHHHERWDGKGYPKGLAGEDIPVGAQIVALADTFEAMTSTNPEREYNHGPRTREKAIEEIKKQSGTQFDPAVVKAFLTLVERNEV